MGGIIGDTKFVNSKAAPLAAHVSHLRHLSTPGSIRAVLSRRFGFSAKEAGKTAPIIASHISQALAFYDTSQLAAYRIRPVLQYYCHLNLAVAVVLAYRPPNHLQYRRHGVRDLSANVRQLQLSTPIVQATRGALTLFNSVISSAPLPTGPIRLVHLAAHIPSLNVELADEFDTRPATIVVKEGLALAERATGQVLCSSIGFHMWEGHAGRFKVPVAALEKAIPLLRIGYSRMTRTATHCTYYSRAAWNADALQPATRAHRHACLQMVNFGAHYVRRGSLIYTWTYLPRHIILPTMTASLLLSFAWASMCRYRPELIHQLEKSRLNLLADVFVNEIDSLMLPAFRNLLFREELIITNHGSL